MKYFNNNNEWKDGRVWKLLTLYWLVLFQFISSPRLLKRITISNILKRIDINISIFVILLFDIVILLFAFKIWTRFDWGQLTCSSKESNGWYRMPMDSGPETAQPENIFGNFFTKLKLIFYNKSISLKVLYN